MSIEVEADVNLEESLPQILSKIDHHEPQFVVEGLIQLLKCLEKTGKGQLEARNWALVIYDALNKIIHEKDDLVVKHLGVALLKILPLVEVDPNLCWDKLTKYDGTVQKILFTMEFCSDWRQKREWLIHLEGFIERMGHSSLHWVDRINSILLDYVSGATDPELWVLVLKVVQALIRNCWMKPSCREWSQIILKILFNQGVIAATKDGTLGLDGHENNVKEKDSLTEMYKNIGQCYHLMIYCEDFKEISSDLRDTLKTMEENRGNNFYQNQFLLEIDKCDVTTLFYSTSDSL